MYYRPTFINGHYYHLYNRGVAKGPIFRDKYDYQRLLNTFGFYLEQKPASRLSKINKSDLKTELNRPAERPLVRLISFCLMPNHFHLLVKQTYKKGVSIFMRRSLDSYTRYFNTKYTRVGTIFQGKFQAVLVEFDEQLLHLSRYIHLNPYVDNLTKKPIDYPWSSYQGFLHGGKTRLANADEIIGIIGNVEEYREFVEDFADYARSFHLLKQTTIERE